MKAIIEKKVEKKPYSSGEDINGKMVEQTTTILFIGITVFKSLVIRLQK